MRRFVIGDIHGAYKALLQCLERSKFDYEYDMLICLGDVVDGWSQVRETFDELLKIRNLVFILGNHDKWFLDWIETGDIPYIWFLQGGRATLNSYHNILAEVPGEVIDLLEKAPLYFLDKENRLFVHGGIDINKSLVKQDDEVLLWDRVLIDKAIITHHENGKHKLTSFKEIFIGHTSTLSYKTVEPINACEVWDLDTGAGWNGKLTIMNVDTKEYWQSDMVADLYPEEYARR